MRTKERPASPRPPPQLPIWGDPPPPTRTETVPTLLPAALSWPEAGLKLGNKGTLGDGAQASVLPPPQ